MKHHFLVPLILAGFATARETPLPVADLQRNTLVDFTKEIVPFLKKNCFACHNEKKAKADLNLESPQAMIIGGDSGPSLVPGKPLESLVFTYSAHLEDDPMPPAKNKAKAVDLNPKELALMRLWIEQGGVGTSAAVLAGPGEWEGLQDVHGIYATAITDDGRFVAAGRGNRIHLYDLHRGSLSAELVDPDLGTSTAHHDNVHSLAFNRDGLLASGGFRNVKIWSRSSDLPAQVEKSLPASPTSLTFSSNSEWLATGDSKGSLILNSLDQKTPAIKIEGKHPAAIRAAIFTADNTTLYSISADNTLICNSVSDPNTCKTIKSLPQSTSLALLEGEQKLAVGGADGVIRLISVAAFKQAADAKPNPPLELEGHGSKVTSLLPFNPEGSQLLSASEDGTVRLWDLGGKQLRQFNHGSPVTSLIGHAGANRIATAGPDGMVRVWDAAKGTKLGELDGDFEFETRRAAATRHRDVAKRIADLRRKQVDASEKQWSELREQTKKQAEALNAALKEFNAKEAILPKLRKEDEVARYEVAQIERATDKSQLGAAQGRAKKATEALQKARDELTTAERKHIGALRNRELAVRDGTKAAEQLLSAQATSTEANGQLVTADELVKKFADEASTIASGGVRSLAISSDGTTLAAGTEKMGVRLWSLNSLQALDTLQRGRDTKSVAFTPDGDLIAVFADNSLARLAPASWHVARHIGDGTSADPFPGRVLSLAFHPRGSLLATGSGIPSRRGELKLWNVHNGALQNEITKPHDDTITGLAFSPDGSHLATASTDRFVKLHRLDTGTLLHKLEGHSNHVLDVAWSADGQTIASAGADMVTKLWSADTGKQLKSEGGYRKEVTSIEFLGTGNDLLVAGGDKTVKTAGQHLGGIEGFVYTVAATPDGQIIVAGGEDGILRVWHAKDRKLLFSFPPPAKAPPKTAVR